jgi:hypothetical protein
LEHVNQKKLAREAQYNDTLQVLLQNILSENKQYTNVYEIEKQAGLVTEQK